VAHYQAYVTSEVFKVTSMGQSCRSTWFRYGPFQQRTVHQLFQ